MGLATRLATARLLFATDAREASGDLATFVSDACAGGVDIVLLADPALSGAAERGALDTLRRAARARQAIVAASGDLGVAERFGADMVVLPDDSSSAAAAKGRLHQWALVGRSCHSVGDVDAALADPSVDFLLVTASLSNVAHAAAAAPPGSPGAKPWFAAGGVTLDYLPALTAAGCRRVVVGRALSRAADPRAAASALDAELRRAWDADPAMERATLAAFSIQPPRPSAGGSPTR